MAANVPHHLPPSRLHPIQRAPPINRLEVAKLARAAPATALPPAFDWRKPSDYKDRNINFKIQGLSLQNDRTQILARQIFHC